MHVTAQNRGQLARQVGSPYDIVAAAEHVAGRADARSFNHLMDA